MRLRRDFTFDRFVPLPHCAEAYRACLAVANGAPRAPRALLLCGPVGKTHLLHAIGNAVFARSPTARIACVSAEELVDQYIDALRRDKDLDLGRKYARYELLLVDDLTVLRRWPRTQKVIAAIFTACIEAGARLVCSAVTPTEIKSLSARLRRLPGARFVAIKQPTQAGIRQILESIAKAQALRLPPQALSAIAKTCGRDVRRAIGMLNKLRLEGSLETHPNGHLAKRRRRSAT